MPSLEGPKAARTRRDILLKAVDVASAEGLEGLTIGRLARATSLSKTGLFAHFGSKEELQLAVVEAAREVFVREVLDPASPAAAGLPRLRALASAWLRYVRGGLFRGGCFFAAAAAEMDDRPGRVRDRVAGLTRSWLDTLSAQAEVARDSGDLEASSDPADLAFEIHAFVQEANHAFQLHGDAEAFDRAARAIRRAIDTRLADQGSTTHA